MAVLPSPSVADDSRQLAVIVSSVVLMAASFIGISLRLYTRLMVLRKIFTEDVLVVLGTMTAFGVSATFTIAAYHGFGKHSSVIDEQDIKLLRASGFAILPLFAVTAILVKTSFLALYLRLDQRKQMRWVVFTLMAAVIMQNICFLIIQIFSCDPPGLGWIPIGTNSDRCWPEITIQAFYNAIGIVTIVLDAAIFMVPLFMLHSLELPQRQKYAVGALFAVGFLPIIAGCLRCYYVWDIVLSKDISYDSVNAAICAQVELHIAILCGSASTFKALLKDSFPSCYGSGDGTEDPFPELQRGGVIDRPLTPWPDDEEKFEQSPTSSETSEQTWSHAKLPGLPDQDVNGPLPPHRVVLSRKISNVAVMPSDLQLRFPTIEGRLGGHNAVMEKAGTKTLDGQQWNLI